MDYSQRIKNLEEQIKRYHTPTTSVVPTSTIYEQIKKQYGFTKITNISRELLNCVYCKQPPKLINNSNNSDTNDYTNTLTCSCAKEVIPTSKAREFINICMQPAELFVQCMTPIDNKSSVNLCVQNWNSMMVGLVIGQINQSDALCYGLSAGLFGEPFKL